MKLFNKIEPVFFICMTRMLSVLAKYVLNAIQTFSRFAYSIKSFSFFFGSQFERFSHCFFFQAGIEADKHSKNIKIPFSYCVCCSL